jgi:hypothetical protein
VSNDFEIAYICQPLAKLRMHKNSMTADRSLTRREFRAIITKWRCDKSVKISDLYYRKILAFLFCMEAFDLLNVNEGVKAKEKIKEAYQSCPLNPLYGLLYFALFLNEKWLIKIFNKLYKSRLSNKTIAEIIRF